MGKQTIEIDVSDYLSADDMRSIAIEEFREVAKVKARDDFQRIMDNAAYELVRREVDAVFDGSMADQVRDKAVSVINRLEAFTVFRRPDAWDREPAKGWVHLQAAVDEAQPQIAERVREVIASMEVDDLRYLIENKVGEVLLARLTTQHPEGGDGR